MRVLVQFARLVPVLGLFVRGFSPSAAWPHHRITAIPTKSPDEQRRGRKVRERRRHAVALRVRRRAHDHAAGQRDGCDQSADVLHRRSLQRGARASPVSTSWCSAASPRRASAAVSTACAITRSCPSPGAPSRYLRATRFRFHVASMAPARRPISRSMDRRATTAMAPT